MPATEHVSSDSPGSAWPWPLLLLLYQKTVIRSSACSFVWSFFLWFQLFAKRCAHSQHASTSACLQTPCQVALPGHCCFSGTLNCPSSLPPPLVTAPREGNPELKCLLHHRCWMPRQGSSLLQHAPGLHFGAVPASPPLVFLSWPPSSSLWDYFCSASTSIFLASRSQTKLAGLPSG